MNLNTRMPALDLPAVCDFSITNICNAACDFCGFARDKTLIGPARCVDAGAYCRALPILHRRGIRYLTFQGGEPLVHPEVVRLVSQTVATGISCAIITNGWFLPRYIKSLAGAGLCQLIEPCNACMMGCYRNASMLMHAAVADTDARALADGKLGAAVATLFRRSVAQSLWALLEEMPKIRHLARRRKQTAAAAVVPRGRSADCKAEAS